jgi:hypothetical protein
MCSVVSGGCLPWLTLGVGSNDVHMKRNHSGLNALALLAGSLLALSGCAVARTAPVPPVSERGHRLLRVSFAGRNGYFRMRIDTGPVETFPISSFTNSMTGLHLEYGDIAIWEAVRGVEGKELSWPSGVSAWWNSYLRGARASFYCLNSDSVREFFAAPLYHWTAPFEKPRPLTSASFYAGGEPLGGGATGFWVMLRAMEAQKSGWLFLLAPRIKNEGQESPWSELDQELAWAGEAGVQNEWNRMIDDGARAELTDFARLADDQ